MKIVWLNNVLNLSKHCLVCKSEEKQEGTAYTHMFLFKHSLSSEIKTIGYNYLIRKNKTKNKTKKIAIFYRELRQLFSFSLEIKRVSIRQTRNSSFKANYGWQRWVLLSFGVLRWVAPSFGVLRWVPPS